MTHQDDEQRGHSQDRHSFETLTAWASGELDDASAAALEAAAREEPEVAGRMRRLRGVLDAIADGEAVRRAAERARSLSDLGTPREVFTAWRSGAASSLARLVHDVLPGVAIAGMRGGDSTARQMSFEAAGSTIDLRIAPASTEPAPTDERLWTIRGRIGVRDDDAAFDPYAASLVPDGAVVPAATSLVDDRGRFRLDATEGDHELLVEMAGGDDVLVFPTLSIGDRS